MPCINVYNKCNNRCLMCLNSQDFWAQDVNNFEFSALVEKIIRFYKGEEVFLGNYRDIFSLTGGEPTLSPHFILLLQIIHKIFPDTLISCLSNGRKFSYEDYTKRILNIHDNMDLIIPIHASRDNIHDKITQVKGSFQQTIRGIENIYNFKKPGQNIEIRITIHKLNYKYIREITEFVRKQLPPINRLVYVFFQIEGSAQKNIKLLQLNYSKLIGYLRDLVRKIEDLPQVQFYHFPLCLIPKELYPYVWRTLSANDVCFLPQCESCTMREFCQGIHKGYIQALGNKEFKPIKDRLEVIRGNSWANPIIAVK